MYLLFVDITCKQWWPEMLDYLGLDEYQLPTLYETGTPIGTILPQIADDL